MQFIPIVERAGSGEAVSGRSVSAEGYGTFLTAIFDEWVRRDVGRVFVQIFDVALGVWVEGHAGLCIFEETCGDALALEHNGDVYSCDHFVEPAHRVGNLMDVPLSEIVTSDQQRAFGLAKRETLPAYCHECDVRFVCNGGCPKNRFIATPDGEPGLNYLCAGYKAFFTHIREPMAHMAAELAARRPPAGVMAFMREKDEVLEVAFRRAGRNDPCPCGSGKKFKRCHGAPGRGVNSPDRA